MPESVHSVEQWPVGRLLPYAANARTHSDAQVAQIASSIAEFGFNVPCLVDERGVLIAGHGRLPAAMKLGLESVPVIRLEHLSDAQARAYRIADNQLTLNSGWNDELLAAELGRLREDGVDLGLLGFDDDELERLLAEAIIPDARSTRYTVLTRTRRETGEQVGFYFVGRAGALRAGRTVAESRPVGADFRAKLLGITTS